jgi:hypothetical protein
VLLDPRPNGGDGLGRGRVAVDVETIAGRQRRHQVTAQHLAHLAARERVDAMKGHRHLVGDELLAARRLERGRLRLADEERHWHLAEARIGRAHHRRVAHPGRVPQDLLHLCGHDLVAAAVDHVADATFDPHESVVVNASKVTGAEVPVGVEPVGEAGARTTTAQVARRHRRPNGQLAELPGGRRAATVVDELDLHSGVRPPDRADLLGVGSGVGGGPPDDLADLRLAVAVEHHDAEPIGEAAGLVRRQRRGDAAHVPQRREVADGGVVGKHRDRGGSRSGARAARRRRSQTPP